MNDTESHIFKQILNLKIKGFVCIRTQIYLNDPDLINSFGELQLSFFDPVNRSNTIYVGIDPRCSGGSGSKLFFLTQWKHIHKPLSESIYYPSQNLDSKFTSGFGCSHLGKLKSLALYAHEGNSGLLRMNFDQGSMNLIIRDQYIQIDMDSSKSLDDIQKECFDSEKGTELLNI